MNKTLYAILGIADNASPADIQRAYEEKLAALQPGDEMVATALREAWNILGNPERRKRYDASLQNTRAAASAVVYEEVPASSRWPLYLLVGAVIAGGGWFITHKTKKPAQTTQMSQADAALTTDPGSTGQNQPGQASTAPTSHSGPMSAEALFAQASNSIVRVNVLAAGGTPLKIGSGIVIGPGRVITNCHVTNGGAGIRVKIGNSQLDASVSIADEKHDLCQLSVSGLGAPAVSVGRSSGLRVGQKVYAIGSPMGLDLTISDGMISSLRETPEGSVIQTTAPVSPGSSGGGLFDENGTLVGVITFQSSQGQNLNFAIPAEWINTMSPSSAQDGRPSDAIGRGDAPASPDNTSALLGSWHCFDPIGGPGMELTFADNSIFSGSINHRPFSGYYALRGKVLTLGNISVQVEDMSPARMVLITSQGFRLACTH